MMRVIDGLIAFLIGYALGCIQTAYLLGIIAGKMDIRDKGSHNAGASNAFMILGWKSGAITALVDILKGTAAVLLVQLLLPSMPAYAYVAGLAAITGHIFPFYLRFRGGKGVATLVGMMLGYDYRLGLLFMLIMLVVPFSSNYMAVGSLTVFTILPVVTYLLDLPLVCLVYALILTVVVYLKHMENLNRIRSGEEVKMSEALKRS
jgi:glycerol-3-phosphate acyltransferase PlsY